MNYINAPCQHCWKNPCICRHGTTDDHAKVYVVSPEVYVFSPEVDLALRLTIIDTFKLKKHLRNGL